MPDDHRKGQGQGNGQPGQKPPARTQSQVSNPRTPAANPPAAPLSGAMKALNTGARAPLSRENPVPSRAEPISGARIPVVPGPRTQSSVSNPGAPITGRMLAMKIGAVESSKEVQKQIQQSGFGTDDVTQFDGLIDGDSKGRSAVERNDSLALKLEFDGKTPAPGLSSRDTLKAVIPPVQSKEGARSAEIYRKALDQFAVGANARYEPDAPGKPRSHIYVWDVTRAMNCEIPHFLGGREMSLGLMVEWVRHEGTMRGWRRATEQVALMAANEGCPVVVLPRELKLKLMAMARPGDPAADGNPFLSGAAVGRGNGLTVKEMFGVFAVEFFIHP